MSIIRTVKKAIRDPKRILHYLLGKRISRVLSDKAFIKLYYYASFGRFPDIEHPKTYNEKLQWLKLYDRRHEYMLMVDKLEAKKYAASVIGEQYVIPTLGVWDDFDEIDFSKLPERFVLKCTHDSGGIVICSDRSVFDKDAARDKINASLKTNYYWHGREWPYKNLKPRIIAEEYVEDEATGELRDYKFFSFDGDTKVMFIATDRFTEGVEMKFNYFDMDFNHLPFSNTHPQADIPPAKPERFDEMKALADKLSKGVPQMRADFYEVNGKVLFGEMTLFHSSGFQPFHPEEWDRIFGDWIVLPEKTE